MIHKLTIGVFDRDAFDQKCVVEVLRSIPKQLVTVALSNYAVSPDEIDLILNEAGDGYDRIVVQYLPPSSRGALLAVRELCTTVPGCIAIDREHRALIDPNDIRVS